MFTKHLVTVTAIAVNSNGSMVASGDKEGHLKIWFPNSESMSPDYELDNPGPISYLEFGAEN